MSDDESLITEELQRRVGREYPPVEVEITPLIVERLLETLGDDDPRWRGEIAPPYVLLAFGRDPDAPETPAVPTGLLTGDEWSVRRPLRVGERLTMSGRLASVHERFGSRYGHSLILRSTWTFTDAAGEVVAETGRTTSRHAPPAEGQRATEGPRPAGAGNGQRGDEGRQRGFPQSGLEAVTAASTEPVFAFVDPASQTSSSAGAGVSTPHSASLPSALAGVRIPHSAFVEGVSLPAAVVRPTMESVVRYCGLTWNFMPFFFDPEAARREGLPGTIVPGPLKFALIARYLTACAGPEGEPRSLRCAYRRPDVTGQPLALRGMVTRVADGGEGRVVDCEVWTENVMGERSVAGSASLFLRR